MGKVQRRWEILRESEREKKREKKKEKKDKKKRKMEVKRGAKAVERGLLLFVANNIRRIQFSLSLLMRGGRPKSGSQKINL